MSRVLRSVRLGLHPTRAFIQCFPELGKGRLPKSNIDGSYLIVLLGVLSALAVSALLLELGAAIWFERTLGVVDLRVFQWLQDRRSPGLDLAFLTITRLGNAPALVAVAVACAALLLLAQRRQAALVMTGCFVSATLSVWGLKWLLQRGRPMPAEPLLAEHNPAFPSGHASLSLVIYMFAAYLISQRLVSVRLRALALAIGLGCAFLVGMSRLYLGVHWLSDVLGGYALGGMWLALLVTLVQKPRFDQAVDGKGPALHGLSWVIAALMLFLAIYGMGWLA